MTTSGGTGPEAVHTACGIAALPHVGTIAGTAGGVGALSLPSHVPIVIAGSPGFPRMGGFRRVRYATVMLVLGATGPAARLAVAATASRTPLARHRELRGAA